MLGVSDSFTTVFAPTKKDSVWEMILFDFVLFGATAAIAPGFNVCKSHIQYCFIELLTS
jgi:hypothetical protein